MPAVAALVVPLPLAFMMPLTVPAPPLADGTTPVISDAATPTVIFAVPLKLVPLIVRAVCRAVAVPALPVTEPVMGAETVSPPSVPTLVRLDAVTPEAKVDPVSVPAAAWIGRRLAGPGIYDGSDDPPWTGAKWPRRAAWADLDGVVHAAADVGPWPEWHAREPLADFLHYPGRPLSARAASGFLRRTAKGTLRFPAGFIDELAAYAERQATGDT